MDHQQVMMLVSRVRNPTLFVSAYPSGCACSLRFLKVVSVSPVLYFSVASMIILRVINQSIVQWCLASTLPVPRDSGKKTAANFLFSNKILVRVIPNSPSLKKDAHQACVLTHITVSPRGWHKDQTRPWITNPSSLLPAKVYPVGQKNWFCNLFLGGVVELFFLSLSLFPISIFPPFYHLINLEQKT